MKIGMDAVIAANFPHEFVALTMLKSVELGVSLAIRSEQPPNASKGFDVSPKPITMKTKTCSREQHVCFLTGFIPWNQPLFGRKNNAPIPDKGFKPAQLFVSLREILMDTEKGEYNELKINNHFLEFKAPLADTLAKRNITFTLDLTRKRQSLRLENNVVDKLTPWIAQQQPKKPRLWPDELLDFETAVDDLYPVSYSLSEDIRLPLQVAATLDGKPITSDADILWIGIPTKLASNFEHKQYNVSNTDELRALLLHYLSLCSRLNTIKNTSLLDQIVSFAKTAGVITPYELLTEKVINDECAKALPHFSNLFQHGPETNNPGNPASLDKKVLHLLQGLPILTENENELVNLVLQKGFLEKYSIRIHPGWNMEKWSPVIKRQIELNQYVQPETLEHYNQFVQLTKTKAAKFATSVADKLNEFKAHKIAELKKVEKSHPLTQLISCRMHFLNHSKTFLQEVLNDNNRPHLIRPLLA